MRRYEWNASLYSNVQTKRYEWCKHLSSLIILGNSTCRAARILLQMFEFLHRRYPWCPGERNCQTQSLSSLGVVWRCGATVSQPSGTGIRNNKLDGCFFSRHNSLAEIWTPVRFSLQMTVMTWFCILTWTGSWSLLISCWSLTPHLGIVFLISNVQSDVWHLDNFQSTWRWNVSNEFNNSLENPVLFQTQLYHFFGWNWSWCWKWSLSSASS